MVENNEAVTQYLGRYPTRASHDDGPEGLIFFAPRIISTAS
jgi:hypothetical protein